MAIRYFEARCQRDKELLRLREKLKRDLLAWLANLICLPARGGLRRVPNLSPTQVAPPWGYLSWAENRKTRSVPRITARSRKSATY